MNNTLDDKYLIWKNSIPMRKAAFTFAPKDLRDQWKSAHKASAITTFMDGLNAAPNPAPEDGPHGLDLFNELMKEPKEILEKRSEIKKTCETNILRYIRSGALQSFAFGAPRTIDASPIELEPRVWGGTRNWSDNTIIHESLTFVEVRLLNPYSIKKLLSANLDKITPSSTRPTVGRPSIKNDIEEAFKALMIEGGIDPSKSAASHYPLIRNWIKENKSSSGIDADNLSSEGIRAHFSPLFKDLKKNRKQ